MKLNWKALLVKDSKSAKELEEHLNEGWDISPMVPPQQVDNGCLFLIFKKKEDGIISPMSDELKKP